MYQEQADITWTRGKAGEASCAQFGKFLTILTCQNDDESSLCLT